MIIQTSAAVAAALVSSADAPATPIQAAPATPFVMPRSDAPASVTAARPGTWGWHIHAF